jgi:hypothetical protein
VNPGIGRTGIRRRTIHSTTTTSVSTAARPHNPAYDIIPRPAVPGGADSEFVVAASQILHEGMAGDDYLGCPIGLQSTHRSKSVLELTVIGFDGIVLVLLEVVPGRGQQRVERGGVDRRGVGDDIAGKHLELPQCPGEEPAGRRGVPALKAKPDRSVDVTPVKPWKASVTGTGCSLVPGQPVKIGRAAAAASSAVPVAPAAEKVTSEVLSRAVSEAAGVSGLMVKLERADETSVSVSVSVEIDYSAFRNAYPSRSRAPAEGLPSRSRCTARTRSLAGTAAREPAVDRAPGRCIPLLFHVLIERREKASRGLRRRGPDRRGRKMLLGHSTVSGYWPSANRWYSSRLAGERNSPIPSPVAGDAADVVITGRTRELHTDPRGGGQQP